MQWPVRALRMVHVAMIHTTGPCTTASKYDWFMDYGWLLWFNHMSDLVHVPAGPYG